jgi:zinc-binding alcohol dehydrogenase/oxidoreductase
LPAVEAWLLEESPGTYRWAEVPDPPLLTGDVAVRPVASALNQMDLWLTRGRPRPPLPHVPGVDVAGVVTEVGSEVAHLAPGDEVVVNPAVTTVEAMALGDDAPLAPGLQIVGEHRWGGHGQRLVVPGRNVVHRPPGRTWEECAAYPTAALSAWRMLRRARLRAGERCLIVGIGGGVSTAAFHLALHLGAEVHVTSRDAAKGAEAVALGAVAAYDSAGDWAVQAHVVVESVGPATWERSMAALVPGGRLVVCGGTSGQTVEVALPRLFYKQHEIIGSTMGSYGEFDTVTALMAEGLGVSIDRVVPLDEYPAALDHLASASQLGKVVLRHDDPPG